MDCILAIGDADGAVGRDPADRWSSGGANISQTAGIIATVAAPIAVLVWTLARPTRSRIKLTLLNGLFAWCRIVAIFCAGRLIFKLLEAGFALSPLLSEGWIERDARTTMVEV